MLVIIIIINIIIVILVTGVGGGAVLRGSGRETVCQLHRGEGEPHHWLPRTEHVHREVRLGQVSQVNR